MSRILRGSALALVLALVLAACAGEATTPPQATGTAPAEECAPPPVKQSGVFTVAAEFPYYEPFLIGAQANPTGFEGEMINAIAQKLGLGEVKWVNIAFDQLYAPGPKQWDVGVSEITITQEREEAVDFSEPYFDANQGLLVRADSPYANATSTDDIRDAKFGAEQGTTGLAFIEEQIKPTQPVSQFDTTDAAAAALKVGTIDIQVIDVPIAIGIRDQSEDVELKVIGQFITQEQYGLAMEEGSPLKPCVDRAIQELKDDGTLSGLQDKYFPGSVDLPVFEV
jgi:polar amino acid transport system substrate-binding protein